MYTITNPLTTRFQRMRWSETRRAIDAMKLNQTITFPKSEFYNCNASVPRLNDAYAGEKQWKLSKMTTVTRVK